MNTNAQALACNNARGGTITFRPTPTARPMTGTLARTWTDGQMVVIELMNGSTYRVFRDTEVTQS